MKTLMTMIFLGTTLLFLNCENQIYVEAGITWSDDKYYGNDGDWYIALSEGCYSNCEGATVRVVDQLPLSRGEDTVKRFVLGAGSSGNITAFVYLDVDGNGAYDDGLDEITGYKFNHSDIHETTDIAVSAFY